MEEEAQQPDVTYVTERIITVFSQDERSLRDVLLMLRAKHGSHFMLVNIAQKNETLRRVNHQVLDTGWVDLLAPGLDQILNVCGLMDNWLQSHPKNVLVLHCKGGKGLCGVIVASYIVFSSMSASAELSLDRCAMRRFHSDQLAAAMTPSQRRSPQDQTGRSMQPLPASLPGPAARLHLGSPSCECRRDGPPVRGPTAGAAAPRRPSGGVL